MGHGDTDGKRTGRGRDADGTRTGRWTGHGRDADRTVDGTSVVSGFSRTYSERNALEGSTTDARRAGMRFANAATRNSNPIAAPQAIGSTKLTP